MIRTISTNRIVLKKFVKFAAIAVPTAVAIFFGFKTLSNR